MPRLFARTVAPADLGSYQQAVRRVLTCDLITAARPRPGVLDQVLRWADELAADLERLFGYTLVATTGHVRLVREIDALDPTQRQTFSRRGRPFDRRRLAYLCLLLAAFQRSQIEISLADLVGRLTPTANAVEGLGYDPTDGTHKAALVDVAHWLVDRGALHLSDGSLEAWAAGGEQGDALFDIDHEVCEVLFRPARPVQHLSSAAGLLSDPLTEGSPREQAARRARRLLVEQPVVYYADVEPAVAAVLRGRGVAEDLARATGLRVERRAEGVLLADPAGTFTDRPFPGRGGAVNRTAGLLLAKVADLLETSLAALVTLPVPPHAADQAELVRLVDAGLPRDGVVAELAWTVEPSSGTREGEANARLEAPLVERGRWETMIHELFAEFGASSFGGAWQQDPYGLLDAALALLAELSLVRPVPGGALVLPAASRYRNLQGALPERADAGQLPLGLSDLRPSDDAQPFDGAPADAEEPAASAEAAAPAPAADHICAEGN
ncbi:MULTISPECIES: DUF2398 family protein [Nocardiopsis]|uniref:TIGR02678 family protein n=1 Tax=Nocardiopsis sinuspersici TaxID=501010 RepID=A0A1V3C0A6_9ACTN|nr:MULTISPECIES: DUF2398 family protein [Nocardiopsis]OOC54247.1 hypothetical protein NOSIN_10880 [Nocardiopsis sinuspersici]